VVQRGTACSPHLVFIIGGCKASFLSAAPQQKSIRTVLPYIGPWSNGLLSMQALLLWNTILRLYGPLEPWFEKTWKSGEIELVK